MGKVTESIYNGKGVIVPLADVQHIETHNPGGLIVVTKHTRWDCDRDVWANNIWIDNSEAEDFKVAWCRYRSELEADTLVDLAPKTCPACGVALSAVDTVPCSFDYGPGHCGVGVSVTR